VTGVYKLVTDTPDRLKILGIGRILLEIFAERNYEVVDGPCRRENIIPPHRLQNMLT
jgi:hypothetical protein